MDASNCAVCRRPHTRVTLRWYRLESGANVRLCEECSKNDRCLIRAQEVVDERHAEEAT